jgi:hypothetical protein
MKLLLMHMEKKLLMTREIVLSWVETALEYAIDTGSWNEEPPELNPPDNLGKLGCTLKFSDGSMWELVVYGTDDDVDDDICSVCLYPKYDCVCREYENR